MVDVQAPIPEMVERSLANTAVRNWRILLEAFEFLGFADVAFMTRDEEPLPGGTSKLVPQVAGTGVVGGVC